MSEERKHRRVKIKYLHKLVINEDIRTTAHSPKGDKAHPRHSVEDERTSHAVRHIPIGWGDERGVTRH